MAEKPVQRNLAVIVLSCFVADLGTKEAAADGKAWAALQQGGAFVLMRHGTAEPRNNPLTHSPGYCAHDRTGKGAFPERPVCAPHCLKVKRSERVAALHATVSIFCCHRRENSLGYHRRGFGGRCPDGDSGNNKIMTEGGSGTWTAKSRWRSIGR